MRKLIALAGVSILALGTPEIANACGAGTSVTDVVTFINVRNHSSSDRGFYVQLNGDSNYYGLDLSDPTFNAMQQFMLTVDAEQAKITITYSGTTGSGACLITEVYKGSPH